MPTIVLVVQVIVRFVFSGLDGPGGNEIIIRTFNIISIILGVINVVAFLPAVITGVVLLVTQKK